MTPATGAEAARTAQAPTEATTSLHDQLDALDAAITDAATRRSEASAARRYRARAGVGKEITRELAEYVDGVRFNKHPADLDEHLRLTKELMARVERGGLVLDPDNQGAIRVLDPKLEVEEKDANEALVKARETRKDFLKEHRPELEAERAIEESRQFREALDAGDADAVRTILDSRSVQPRSTLTSDEVPTTAG